MKRGFTLLEVLTVIVILGLLAVVITPKIIDTVSISEEKTILASAKGYIKAVNKYLVENDMTEAGTYFVAKTNEGIGPVNDLIEVEGKLPEGDTITIDSNYTTINAVLTFGNFKVTYDGKDYNVELIEE